MTTIAFSYQVVNITRLILNLYEISTLQQLDTKVNEKF